MNLEQRESGLVVATMQPPAPILPPEHPARKVIRDALAKLADEFGGFEQTCHGRIGPNDAESVLLALAKCYENPTAYTISNAAQALRHLIAEPPQ